MDKEERKEIKIADKIWNTPFASRNLQILKKSQLITLIEDILDRIIWEKPEYQERDIKDILFEEKCWLIETLVPSYFGKKEKTMRNKSRDREGIK